MNKAFFIPHLGFQMELAQDWTFRVYDEHRNGKLLEVSGLMKQHPRMKHDNYWHMSVSERNKAWRDCPWLTVSGDINGNHVTSDAYVPVTLRAGTLLKVERIYIRQGSEGFDSVTFRASRLVTEPDDSLFKAPKTTKSLRFWVKLDDANKIIFKGIQND